MKKFKSHFVFTKQQRSGIFFLLLLIIIFQIVYFFATPINNWISSKEDIDIDLKELVAFQDKIDSIKIKVLEKPKFYPFNPNYISDFKGYSLGMSVEEIDRLLMFRSQGKFINTTEEFQQTTKISDSLLKEIAPYFKFPKRKSRSFLNKKGEFQKSTSHKFIEIKDLNKVTAKELQEVSGIGVKLSKRIIKYRDFLGGFIVNDQLYEVYGLDTVVVKKALKQFKVVTIPKIIRLNVNNASVSELSNIPYLSFVEAKKIITYRSEFGRINSIEDLRKIQDFSTEKINRIELYLNID